MDEELKRLLDVMQAKSTAAHEDTRRHFDVVAEHLRRDMKTVVEGVITCNQRIDRLETSIKGEFAEVRAMIKFSYADLDRRLDTMEETQRKLEDAVTNLQTRIERLESPPQ